MLRLSCSQCLEECATVLKNFLPQFSPQHPVVVQLQVEERGIFAPRSDVVARLEHIYNVASAVDLRTNLTVVPVSESRDLLSASSIGKNWDQCFGYVAVGGTFDRLHVGHKLLLTVCVLHTLKRLRVGVADDFLLGNKRHADLLQKLDVRCTNVEKFLRQLRGDLELEIEPINEFSGGTNRIPGVEALVASPETLPSIPRINQARAENSLPPLVPIPISFVGGNNIVSSTKLRALELENSGASVN